MARTPASHMNTERVETAAHRGSKYSKREPSTMSRQMLGRGEYAIRERPLDGQIPFGCSLKISPSFSQIFKFLFCLKNEEEKDKHKHTHRHNQVRVIERPSHIRSQLTAIITN